MRPSLVILVIGLAMAMTASVVRADAFVSVFKKDVVLEATPGYYDERPFDVALGIWAMRTTVTIRKLKSDAEWKPGFGFAVAAADESNVRFRVSSGNLSKLTAVLGKFGDTWTPKIETFAFVPRVNEPFDLEMTWTETGHVTAIVRSRDGEERREVELGAPPKQFSISASTGRMELAPLELGYMSGDKH